MQSIGNSGNTLSYIRAGIIEKTYKTKKTVDIRDSQDGKVVFDVSIISPALTYDEQHKEDRGFIYVPKKGDKCIYTNVFGVGYAIIGYLPTVDDNISDNTAAAHQEGSLTINTPRMEGVYVQPGIGATLYASVAAFVKVLGLGRLVIKAATYIKKWMGGYESAEIDTKTNKTSWKKAIYPKAYTLKELSAHLGEDPPGVYFSNDETTLNIYAIGDTSTSKIEFNPSSDAINIYQGTSSTPTLIIKNGVVQVYGNLLVAQ